MGHRVVYCFPWGEMLLAMKSGVEAMRAVAYLCALAFDLGREHPATDTREYFRRRGDFLTPIVKGWCTEFGQELASVGIQIHGGMGFIEETGAAQYLRDARITTIYEGTTGIQAQDLVGRKTLRDGGTAARELLAEMQTDLASWATVAEPRLHVLARELAAGVAAVERSVAWLIDSEASDPRLSAAASVSYLKLWGIVTGGWQLVRAAALCFEDCHAQSADQAFARRKIASAEFFATQVLPQATSLAHIIEVGSQAVLVPTEEAFA